jgi:phosphate transport system permease protein
MRGDSNKMELLTEKRDLPVISRKRRLTDKLMTGLVMIGVGLAVLFLVVILVDTVIRGAPVVNWSFLTSVPVPVGIPGGGIGPELVGTFILVGIATLISVPIGVGAGIFFSEWRESKLSFLAGFANDVLAEFPSMVIGIFVYLLLVLAMGGFSAIAGAVALSIIMIPIVARTTDESLKIVPRTLREASIALGVSRTKTVMKVVIGTGKAGLATGILLAVARAAGETAPLIVTSFSFVSSYYPTSLTHPISALPVLIWLYGISPFATWQAKAWGAALILVLIMLAMNLSIKFFIGRRFGAVRAEI